MSFDAFVFGACAVVVVIAIAAFAYVIFTGRVQ